MLGCFVIRMSFYGSRKSASHTGSRATPKATPKRHPERHPNLPQQGTCPFCALATIAECRETIGRRRASGLQDSSRNSFQNPCLQAQAKLSQGPCRKVIPIVAVESQQHEARPPSSTITVWAQNPCKATGPYIPSFDRSSNG